MQHNNNNYVKCNFIQSDNFQNTQRLEKGDDYTLCIAIVSKFFFFLHIERNLERGICCEKR